MCLAPIKITSRSRYLGLGSSYVQYVPCGKCAECRNMKSSDYLLRAFYQFMECQKYGGYMLFDTLTYNNENLPTISEFLPTVAPNSEYNFSCFRPSDYTNFLKRLRIQLSRLGYQSNKCFKYFLSTEYGSSKEYTDVYGNKRVGTSRPHYHILFYVYDPDLDPITLSTCIADAWQLGRTDGIYYQSEAYVMNHTYGAQYNTNQSHINNICNYVAKYVNKDSKFEEQLDRRLSALRCHLAGKNVPDETSERYLSRVKNCINQFTRHSTNFGAYALSQNDLSYIMTYGGLQMPNTDAKKPKIHVPLSNYFRRKLFYEKIETPEGFAQWKLNDLGRTYKVRRLADMTNRLSTRYRGWYNNLDDDVRSYVDKLLGDRSWTDLAIYNVFYRGRVMTVDYNKKLIPNLYDQCKYVLDSDANGYYRNYNTPKDKKLFGRYFVDLRPHAPSFLFKGLPSIKELDNSHGLLSEKDCYKVNDYYITPEFLKYFNGSVGQFNHYLTKVRKLDYVHKNRTSEVRMAIKRLFRQKHGECLDYVRQGDYHKDNFLCDRRYFTKYMVYNEFRCDAWHNFDLLLALYQKYITLSNADKQDYADFMEEYKKRLKFEGLL